MKTKNDLLVSCSLPHNILISSFSVRSIFVFLCGIIFLGNSSNSKAEWVEWIADAEVCFTYNDNINRSLFNDERTSNTAHSSYVSLGRYKQLTDSTRLRVTTDLEIGTYNKFELLNYSSAGVTLALRHKLGIGPNVPWLGAHVSATTMNVRDNVRDSSLYNLGLQVGKRFSPRFDGEIKYEYKLRDGEDGEITMKNIMHGIDTDVFDQKSHTLSFIANYLASRKVLMTVGYSYRDGDFDSNCSLGNFETVWHEEKVHATTSDKVFGGLVYRLEGGAHVLSLGASYALGGHASLNLGFQRQEGKGNTFRWKSSIVHASFIYSY